VPGGSKRRKNTEIEADPDFHSDFTPKSQLNYDPHLTRAPGLPGPTVDLHGTFVHGGILALRSSISGCWIFYFRALCLQVRGQAR